MCRLIHAWPSHRMLHRILSRFSPASLPLVSRLPAAAEVLPQSVQLLTDSLYPCPVIFRHLKPKNFLHIKPFHKAGILLFQAVCLLLVKLTISQFTELKVIPKAHRDL